jgi:membrane protein YqaA with SNARE-associated domain
LKHFFVHLWHKWNVVWLPAILHLGIWGAGAVAVLDSSSIPVPMDAILAVWIWQNRGHFWLYCVMAAAGSAVGGLVPYGLGRAGGELFLLKKINRERLEAMRTRFEQQEFWAVAIPSMLPPPTPWKAVVLAAGVFEMRVVLFMLAVFTGRLIRWLVLSLLVIELGPGAVQVVERHALTVLGVVAALAILGGAVWWRKKRRRTTG